MIHPETIGTQNIEHVCTAVSCHRSVLAILDMFPPTDEHSFSGLDVWDRLKTKTHLRLISIASSPPPERFMLPKFYSGGGITSPKQNTRQRSQDELVRLINETLP